jgi:uncharacterized protein YukE
MKRMGAITHGMDVGAVRQLAAQMGQRADEIDQLSAALTAALDGAAWLGPDAEQFRGDWSGQYVAQLKAVAQALREAAQRANTNAQEQEDVASR